MVVPIRDIGNKTFSISANMTSNTNMTLPSSKDMDINNIISSNIDSYDDMREQIMSSNKNSLRTVSMSSSETLVDYATIFKMKHLNDLPDDEEIRVPTNSFQLSYMTSRGQDNQVSKMADPSFSMEQQCVSNEDSASSRITNFNEHMFNIQLSYNSN